MLNLDRVQAITLDLDDTLWPVHATIVRAEAALSAWLAAHAPAAAKASTDVELRKRLRQQVQSQYAECTHDLSLLRLEAIRALLNHAGEPAHLAEPAFEVFFAARQQVDLFDDALEALVFWSTRYPVVAVSNGNADVHRVGLGAYFHASVSARDVGVAKPHLSIFEQAARVAGCAPEAVLHIGDDANTDALGAMDAGMQTVWVNRAGHDWPHVHVKPHAEVSDLRALCALWP